jgi:hypothetical protein
VLLDLIAFNGTCYLDSAPEQQEFLRERGFAGIRVGNDRERSSFLYFTVVFHAAAKVNLSGLFPKFAKQCAYENDAAERREQSTPNEFQLGKKSLCSQGDVQKNPD